MSSAFRLLVAVVVLGLVAAACGDSGSSILDEASDDAAITDDGGPSDGDGEDDNGDGDVTSDTINVDDIGDLSDIPGVSDECAAIFEVLTGIGAIFLGDAEGANELLARAADDLPGELSDDIDALREAADEYAQVLEDLDIDPNDPNSFAELSEEEQIQFAQASEIFNDPAVNDALDTLNDYANAECDDAGFTP